MDQSDATASVQTSDEIVGGYLDIRLVLFVIGEDVGLDDFIAQAGGCVADQLVRLAVGR